MKRKVIRTSYDYKECKYVKNPVRRKRILKKVKRKLMRKLNKECIKKQLGEV